MKEKRVKTRKQKIFNALFVVLIFFLLSQLILKLCFFTSIVSQSSMEPTLYHNNVGLTDAVFFKIFGINRFDIVVIDRGNDEYYVKRVIGLPGEKVDYRIEDGQGKLYINGKYIKEDFISEDAKRKTCIETQSFCSDGITLTNSQYFVMGDNRGNSHDSRFSTLGPIEEKDIIGRGFFKYGTCKNPDCTKIDYGF